MRNIPLMTDQIRLAHTSSSMFQILLEQRQEQLFRRSGFYRTLFVGSHFRGTDHTGAFDDAQSNDPFGVATLTRTRRLNEDMPSEAADREIRTLRFGVNWPAAASHHSYAAHFQSMGTDPEETVVPMSDGLNPQVIQADFEKQRIHTAVRNLRRIDEEVRFAAPGGKAEILLRNLEAFFLGNVPLFVVDRCRSITCLRLKLASELYRSEGLFFCRECYKHYCDENYMSMILPILSYTLPD